MYCHRQFDIGEGTEIEYNGTVCMGQFHGVGNRQRRMTLAKLLKWPEMTKVSKAMLLNLHPSIELPATLSIPPSLHPSMGNVRMASSSLIGRGLNGIDRLWRTTPLQI